MGSLMKGKGSSIVKHIMAKVRAMKARIMVTVMSKKETKIKEQVMVMVMEESSHNYSMDSSFEVEDDYYKYPDLTHTLFDEEIAHLLDDPNASASAIDIVKNSKEDFNLEDEIDEVADLFITKFHRRMRLQKLLSFKRHQQQQGTATA